MCTKPTGSSQIQEREEDAEWTIESNIIFFTDLLFAGITDAISGFSQHVVVLLFPKTTPSIAVEFFFFIAFFFGSVMIAAISSLGLLCFTTNFWALEPSPGKRPIGLQKWFQRRHPARARAGVHQVQARPKARSSKLLLEGVDSQVEDFQALEKQKAWTLVPYQPSMNVVGCKWVFKLKKNANGSVSRHKARLVAKGFHQEAGLDYDETFSPVVKHSTVRLAPRAWNERFTTHLLTLGFVQSLADTSLFVPASGSDLLILLLYVDDIILTGNNLLLIQQTITALGHEFNMKDLGELTYFLGLQVQYTSSGIHVNQSKYATDLLAKASMTHCEPCPIPCLPTTKLLKFDGVPLSDPTLYRSLVGGLQYLTFSRPDIAFAVNTLCQFMHTPTEPHFAVVKRVLRYLAGTLTHGIHFTYGGVHLQAYSDDDWASDVNDRRSTTGYVVFLGNNPISWCAKKQSTVSRSSTEAEYRALAITAAEMSWLRQLLRNLHLFLDRPPILWCDNISALALASNPVFHARTKHIEIDFHFIRERVTRGDMVVSHIPSSNQLADIFTKGLHTSQFSYLREL
ncbi:hypothetical protein L3X38_008086 [Prunus dulcis]|uniref:Reverse transcriptase Ty1/copia-type domain-containing protein n=1 Tax=Prunus dulcis TaxID=3755 RepID=A0AAD4ZW75_PRUDU|nr:hypothetical protein L3X38_008086 [Prunus dulcis]